MIKSQGVGLNIGRLFGVVDHDFSFAAWDHNVYLIIIGFVWIRLFVDLV